MRRISLTPFRTVHCPEHGTIGALPCAWPGCRNGINEEQFEEDTLIEGHLGQQFTRRRWQSPLGDDYYTWESGEMQNWFFLRNTFWNEARRHGLVLQDEASVVYHYTSIDGLLGIVKSGSVWLSDYSYLNDSRELAHGAAIALEVIDEILGQEPAAAPSKDLTGLREQLARFPNRVCIASFSEDSDSLAQWRAYGQIAIGFDVSALSLHVDQGTLRRVEYREDVQRKLITIYVHHALAAAARDAEAGKFGNIRLADIRPEQLLEIIAFFKSPGFSSEREMRLAYVDNPELLKRLGFERLPKSFRVCRGRLLPYVSSTEVLKSKHRNFPLKFTEIVLGPNTDDLLVRGVREFLDEMGLDQVPVRRSAIPFRP